MNKHMSNSMKVHAWSCVGFATAALCCSIAVAQSRQIPAPPQNGAVIISDATIHPVSSDVIQRGHIVIEKGVITHIGKGAAPAINDSDAVVLDATGLHVYPGLILASTSLGQTEIGDIQQTIDTTELGRIKPEVRAAAAVNPDSDLIPVTRANGILTGVVMPRGGLIAGRASIIRFDGWTWEDMSINADAGLVINWPRTDGGGGGRFGRRVQPELNEEETRSAANADIEALDKWFDESAAYVKAKDSDPSVTTDLRYEAMRGILTREKPIFISASMAGQIEAAVAWSVRRNLRIVIWGGSQADHCAALLKKHDVPVIITGIHRLPTRRQDSYDSAYTLPAKLHEAGVRFCITAGGEAAHERHLNHHAATAAAYGLPKDEALKAVTLYAAQIIGCGDKLGSLEVGKSATLILTGGTGGGDPLEITTDTLVAFIDGRRIDLGNRHKTLYAKYQEKYRQLGLLGSMAKKDGEDKSTHAHGTQ